MSLYLTEPQQVLLLKYLIQPVVPREEGRKRIDPKPSEIKILYALYQLNKNLRNDRKWTKVAPGKNLIAKASKVSRKSVTKFITGPDFSVFCKKTNRYMETNIYELEDWVVNLFKFLEVKGMMKNFRQEFKSWKSSFLKRLDKWLLPLLDSGVSLRRILMNKLSTKNNLKGAARKSLKGAAIKSYGVHEAFQGFKSNSESSPISAFNDLFKIGEELNNDFKIQNGDLNWLINSFSLRDLKAGIIIRRQWQKNGIQVRSPIRTFMGAMNKREKSISKDRSWKKKPQMSISESKQILSDKGSQTLVCLGSLLGI